MNAGNNRPLLLGHRGCRVSQFPENSMSAFQHALTCGLDGFEFDLRASADGRLPCIHDDAIGGYLVADSPYHELYKGYLSFKHTHGEPIPCLQDVLREFGHLAFLDIEIKVAGFEKAVLKLVRQYPPHRFVISSFLAEVLLDVAEANPEVPLGFIFDDVSGLRAYRNVRVSYLMPRHDLLTRELVETFHRDGYKVVTWTVNRARDITRLASWGVDGLISDDPVLLRRTVDGN
ncbi:MAG: glycerophosphodiester phosphodiesterase [Terriglobia bacterium]|jgi:glycerophosphoryl diester phosphodiesterase|nr:glycerophosphodiester phosphodiesterase [Terriglobia bacterium]